MVNEKLSILGFAKLSPLIRHCVHRPAHSQGEGVHIQTYSAAGREKIKQPVSCLNEWRVRQNWRERERGRLVCNKYIY